MKIKDLKDKLPCRVKITSGYTLEESIDPGFVVDVVQIEIDKSWENEDCYKIWFSIPPELISICTKVAKTDWLDEYRKPNLNYFEANRSLNRSGTYRDTAYVMENDDWFEFYEEPKSEFIQVKVLQDESHSYIVPQELWDDWEGLMLALDSSVEDIDLFYSLIDDFNDKFTKYRVGGDVNNYQLFILQDELKRLTNE